MSIHFNTIGDAWNKNKNPILYSHFIGWFIFQKSDDMCFYWHHSNNYALLKINVSIQVTQTIVSYSYSYLVVLRKFTSQPKGWITWKSTLKSVNIHQNTCFTDIVWCFSCSVNYICMQKRYVRCKSGMRDAVHTCWFTSRKSCTHYLLLFSNGWVKIWSKLIQFLFDMLNHAHWIWIHLNISVVLKYRGITIRNK